MTEDRVIDEYERLFVFNRAADLQGERCRFVNKALCEGYSSWLVEVKKVDLSLYSSAQGSSDVSFSADGDGTLTLTFG